MRRTPILVAAMAIAWAAQAEAQVDADQARAEYEAELARQCPAKHLELLSARDLRDGLDDYAASLPAEVRGRLQGAEQAGCSSLDAGAACVNAADLAATDGAGRIGELAGWICASFNGCTDQGACTYSR